MVTPPYAPSARWWSIFLKGLTSDGLNAADAMSAANRVAGISGKGFARCTVTGNSGTSSLSVAIEGGSHALSRRGREHTAAISLHGNWPHAHLGALEAAYGRAPYYIHLMPRLRDILQSPPPTLRELNVEVNKCISDFLGIKGRRLPLTEAAAERGDEIAAEIDPELSILEAAMRLGPETVLGLLRMDTDNECMRGE